MFESIFSLWPLALALIATGVVAGLLAGLLGVGGGIVIVPILYNVFSAIGVAEEVRMHLAVGTSLATIIPTSIRSLRSHARKGAVDWDLLKAWGPGLCVGVILGSVLAGFVDGKLLAGVFATVALIVALNMAFGRKDWRISDEPPRGPVRDAMTGAIGAVSAMMGIGGGTLGVPIMTLLGYSVQRAVATSSGLGLIISIPGAIGFMIAGLGDDQLPPASVGYVSLLGFILITPMTVLAAPLGVRWAHALPQKRLAQAFAFFLAVTALRMASSLF